jgi:hypothetical protein
VFPVALSINRCVQICHKIKSAGGVSSFNKLVGFRASMTLQAWIAQKAPFDFSY